MKTKIIAALLLILGMTQMVADLTGLKAVKGLAAATGASPAPKVFSAHRGLETFSSKFVVSWDNPDGSKEELEITPAVNSKLQGPYNRRNVYGAAISYGPVLAVDKHGAPMFKSVANYAFANGAPVLKELVGREDLNPSNIRVKVIPRKEATPDAELPLEFGGFDNE